MPLPESRDTTYTTDAPVKSVDLNQVQDCIVAGAHGAVVATAHAYAFERVGQSLAGGGWIEWTGASSAFWAPQLRAGDRVSQLVLRVYGNAVADFTIGVYKYSSAAAATQLCPGGTTFAVTNPAAAWADVVIDLIDSTLAAGESLMVEVAGNAAGLRLLNAQLTHTHPLP